MGGERVGVALGVGRGIEGATLAPATPGGFHEVRANGDVSMLENEGDRVTMVINQQDWTVLCLCAARSRGFGKSSERIGREVMGREKGGQLGVGKMMESRRRRSSSLYTGVCVCACVCDFVCCARRLPMCLGNLKNDAMVVVFLHKQHVTAKREIIKMQ